jgi:hypothetical protein
MKMERVSMKLGLIRALIHVFVDYVFGRQILMCKEVCQAATKREV